jgi:hypothetical protein
MEFMRGLSLAAFVATRPDYGLAHFKQAHTHETGAAGK